MLGKCWIIHSWHSGIQGLPHQRFIRPYHPEIILEVIGWLHNWDMLVIHRSRGERVLSFGKYCKITGFNREINYKMGLVNSYVSLPEGMFFSCEQFFEGHSSQIFWVFPATYVSLVYREKATYVRIPHEFIPLVGGLEHFLFFHILGIIIPLDFHIFQRGSYTTNQTHRLSIDYP